MTALKEPPPVPKPPPSTPHSDLDGVHRDEKPNVDTANAAGQDSGDLKRAQSQSTARPPHSDDKGDGQGATARSASARPSKR